MNDALWSTGNADWATPPDLFARLDAEFHFRLDVAAVRANATVRNWFGPDHSDPGRRDGLAVDWSEWADDGAVWCNPPYGRGIAEWMATADRSGLVVVCLVPARVDTAWFHDHCLHHEVRWLRGRLRFGGHAQFAPFPSCVVVMRPVTDSRHCPCGERLTGRADAVFCSGRCRMAAHRMQRLHA